MTDHRPVTQVLLFARARELAGTRSAELPGSTVGEVVAAAESRYGEEFAELCRTCTVVVDGEVVLRSEFDRRPAGSELAILPPVSGGAHDAADSREVGGTHDVAGAARLRVAVLTVSDRVSRGEYPDETGPAVERTASALLGATVVARDVVPDDAARIAGALAPWCDEDVADLVLTNGGTGLAPRDVTPEAVRAVLDVESPGIAELMRCAGMAHTPLAALSRQVAGRRRHAVVVTLPGSVKGAVESLEAVAGILGHAVAMARTGA